MKIFDNSLFYFVQKKILGDYVDYTEHIANLYFFNIFHEINLHFYAKPF